jgi:hypothetical protein
MLIRGERPLVEPFFHVSVLFYRAGRAHSHIELGEAGIGHPNFVKFQLKDKRIFINLARGERRLAEDRRRIIPDRRWSGRSAPSGVLLCIA